MNTQRSRQKWFLCFSPDGLIARKDAVNLIHKHAANHLVLFTDLTDAQIRDELPTAWLREHQQADMFRDAAEKVANDENYPPEPTGVRRRGNWSRAWDYLKKKLLGLFGQPR